MIAAVDLSVGAFSENPPWLIDPEQLTWRAGLTAIRSVARRQVPELIAPRRWPGSRALRVVTVIGYAGATWCLRDGPRRGVGAGDGTTRSASRSGISGRMRLAEGRLGPPYFRLGRI